MKDVSIIGAGRLGTSLGQALARSGFRIRALTCQHLRSAQESSRIIGQGEPSTDNAQAANKAGIVALCIPDGGIEEVAAGLASGKIEWRKKFVFHSSGLLSSRVLEPLKKKGALAASIHPIQSFPKKSASPEAFKGIYFGIEGTQRARAVSQEIVRRLEGKPLILRPEDKPLYHAACSVASNFFVVLVDEAVTLLSSLGLEKELAFQSLLPLVKGTLQNIKEFNTSAALTGPLIRGDKKSLEAHLKALESFPSFRQSYLKLAGQALELAKREKIISGAKIRALKNLLEEK